MGQAEMGELRVRSVRSSAHLGHRSRGREEVQCGANIWRALGRWAWLQGEHTGQSNLFSWISGQALLGPALSHSSWAFQVSHIGK